MMCPKKNGPQPCGPFLADFSPACSRARRWRRCAATFPPGRAAGRRGRTTITQILAPSSAYEPIEHHDVANVSADCRVQVLSVRRPRYMSRDGAHRAAVSRSASARRLEPDARHSDARDAISHRGGSGIEAAVAPSIRWASDRTDGECGRGHSAAQVMPPIGD